MLLYINVTLPQRIKEKSYILANQSISTDMLATNEFLQMKSRWKCKECHAGQRVETPVGTERHPVGCWNSVGQPQGWQSTSWDIRHFIKPGFWHLFLGSCWYYDFLTPSRHVHRSTYICIETIFWRISVMVFAWAPQPLHKGLDKNSWLVEIGV